jgi:cell division protein FtsW
MVAERIGLQPYHFVHRHLVFVLVTAAVMFAVSLLNVSKIKLLALIMLLVSIIIMLLLPFIGYENKGAVRWVRLAGFSLQPSEFMKPAFVIVTAWIFSQRLHNSHFPCVKLAIGLYVLVGRLTHFAA